MNLTLSRFPEDTFLHDVAQFCIHVTRKFVSSNCTNFRKADSATSILNSNFDTYTIISMNIDSIRGKKLELLAFLDFHQPHVVAIQETKIDSSVATSELFPETCPYSVYRKDRNIHGGGVMLLIHKDISHMPITELENDSESIWVKVFANKTSLCGKLVSTAW